ncbi:MAG: DUF2164 domain-containing protein [Planctomycetota bacterium]|jgi:uncharacterized protein (DUF2164 family)
MTITIDAELKQRIFEAIQACCREHLECDPGLLKTQVLYERLLGLLGPAVYNQAIADAQAWMQGRLMDLEGDLHETVDLGA